MDAGGPAMYERFTDRSRNVMQLANREALRFNHEYIGTEHVLLGLIKDDSGVAANALKNLGIDSRKVRLEIEKIIQMGPGRYDGETRKLPLTPRAKKAIEFAIEEARGLNHNYVGTEHLLLGLMREQEGVAAQVLMNVGLTAEHIRDEVKNLLGLRLAPRADTPVVHDVAVNKTTDVFALQLPPEIRDLVADLTRRIETAQAEKLHAVGTQNFDWAAGAREREANLTRARDAILRELWGQPPEESAAGR
jgi:ATP-dependent Clp protease ATP-binding subunit ClpA